MIGPDGWPINSEDPEIEQPSPITSTSQPDGSNGSTQTEEIELPSNALSKPVSAETLHLAPPSVTQGYVYQQYRPAHLQPPWRDPNVLDVVNPRQWGTGQSTQVDLVQAAAAQDQHQGWAADETLAEWRVQVCQEASPDQSLDESSGPVADAQDDVPDRPDSVPPIPPPVTAYVSSEEESTTSTPRQVPTEVGDITPPPLVKDMSPSSEEPLPTPTGPSGNNTRPTIADVEVDGQVVASPPRTLKPRRMFGPGAGGAWWKRDPHPAHSAEFASRRLLVS